MSVGAQCHHPNVMLLDAAPTTAGPPKDQRYLWCRDCGLLLTAFPKVDIAPEMQGSSVDKTANLQGALATLRMIASNTCCGKCQEAALVAREFLNRTPSPEARETAEPVSQDRLRELWQLATPLRMPELPPHELGVREVAFARFVESEVMAALASQGAEGRQPLSEKIERLRHCWETMRWCKETSDAIEALLSEEPTGRQPLSEDTARLNWLETKVVNVREKLVYGSRDLFWSSPEQDDPSDSPGPSDIRKRIDSALLSESTTGGKSHE